MKTYITHQIVKAKPVKRAYCYDGMVGSLRYFDVDEVVPDKWYFTQEGMLVNFDDGSEVFVENGLFSKLFIELEVDDD